LLKESRARGEGYWYAYSSHGGKTAKKYLGRTGSLSLELLEDAARALSSHTDKQISPGLQSTTSPEIVRPLLQAKLCLPRPRPFLLSRPHLLARLDAGLKRRLTLVLAPAGSGKTTLVSSWAVRLQRQDDTSVVWLALDTGDNDPVRFWRYIIAACQTLHPALRKSSYVLAHLWREISFDLDQVLFVVTTLLNELHDCSERAVLVLEDYHTISSPLIHQSLAAFIDHLPPPLHVVLITRNDPPFPLARLRASNELSEMLSADLRFSVEETEAFLKYAILFHFRPRLLAALLSAPRAGPLVYNWLLLSCKNAATLWVSSMFLLRFVVTIAMSWNICWPRCSLPNQSHFRLFCFKQASLIV